LKRSPDVVPITAHSGGAQARAWNDGADNGWNTIGGCRTEDAYGCYDVFTPKQIPNITALARKYALSDHTQTCQPEASWNDKLTWGSACDADGFLGKNPQPPPGEPDVEGWGCAADKVTPWSGDGGATSSEEPSCVPDYSTGLPYGGAFEETPVSEQDSVFQNCDNVAGCTWADYNTDIVWSPTAMRAYTVYVHSNRKTPQQFVADAQAGNLPSISFVTSSLVAANDSQHNGDSMTIGDNTIGDEVSAVMSGPDWDSTAIFLTWDDCGCQYDPVAPNRVPMIIISPYAKKAFTDSTPTTFAGVVRFMETTFGLAAMNTNDENEYDYENAFDFSQRPLGGLPMTHSHVTAAARHATLTNKENEDDDS
jgi:phospholipase C